MKLHQLTLQAFGPFADRQHIDFQRLGDNPLFLIDGATGAGKSSILHAICYALYGETTDAERKDLSVRCDQAKPDVLTQVTLEFSIKSMRYRITRTPTQMRASKRGDKQVKHNASAELIGMDDSGNETLLVAKKKTEADEHISQIVGLSVDQFRQVMVLPQGKFRELLLANSTERQAILSTLFATDIYQKIEQKIKDKATDIERQYRQFIERVNDTLDDIDCENAEQLAQLVQQTAQTANEQQANKQQADTHRRAVSERYQQASNLRQLFKQQQQAGENLARVNANQAKIEQLVEQHQSILRAQKIDSHWQALQTISTQKTRIVNQHRQWLEQKQQQVLAHQRIKEQYQQAKQDSQCRDELLSQINRLTAMLPLQQQLTQVGDSFDQAERAQQQAKTELTHTQAEYQQLAERSDKGRALIEQSQQQLQKRHAVQIELQNIQQQYQLKQQYDQLTNELNGHVQQHQQAKQRVEQDRYDSQQAERIYHQQASIYHASQATVLAKQLQAGHPCPVCGATQHPHPAEAQAAHTVDKAQLEQAHQHWQAQHLKLSASDKTLQQHQVLWQQTEQALTKLKTQLSEQFDATAQWTCEQLEQRIAALESQLSKLDEVANNLDKWQRNQQRMQASLAPLQSKISELNARLPELASQRAKAEQALLQARQSVPEEYRGNGVITQQVEQLQQQIKRLDTQQIQAQEALDQVTQQLTALDAHISQSVDSLAELEQREQQAQTNWQQIRLQHGFEQQIDFERALASEPQVEQIQRQIDEHNTQREQLTGQLSALATQLEKQQPPDVEALEQQRLAAEQQYNEVEQLHNQTVLYHRRLVSAQEKIKRLEQQQAQSKSEYEIIGNLAAAASGRGSVRVSLERFVLADLLDSVLAIASKRLQVMSRGQYELMRQDEQQQKRNVSAGLDLAVYDNYSSKVRPVATLSGGESFMASLALALALSDVVQQCSGGIVLDTLFIDEGFGSLDQDALQLAIETLIDLQTTGRSIGIISHVSELKEQMAKRIDVKRSRQGSTITLVS
ncbi:SMC family ATPase [Thalassotalea ponticola]|uniref:AAA family ATPase n=1 Tax=Thalassotalea ponticola TaxID=1523392 RepID=UPI0025B575BA|nr:SMC family ATPase [Thalassotalea ponticola]MDN3652529.1 SMC family ATPase [Thalassotalea ponticola]